MKFFKIFKKIEGKIKFFIMIMIMILLVVSVEASEAKASANFEKVAQAELGKREAILNTLKNEIDTLFQRFPEDNLISYKEMKILQSKIEIFDKIKSQFNEELKFYKKTCKTEIDVVYRSHIKSYFVDSSIFGYYSDTRDEKIRRFWVEKTGRDIKIEIRKNYPQRFSMAIFIGLMGILFVTVVLGLVELERKISFKFKTWLITAGTVFACIITFFLLI